MLMFKLFFNFDFTLCDKMRASFRILCNLIRHKLTVHKYHIAWVCKDVFIENLFSEYYVEDITGIN